MPRAWFARSGRKVSVDGHDEQVLAALPRSPHERVRLVSWSTGIRLLPVLRRPLRASELECDLLVVGGSEAGVAAAVQAARLGVASIVLVNDIDWLGGQFTSEGLCAIDEWTVLGHRTPFPRSGLFLEVMDRIEEANQQKYGLRRPGNCWCAWTTCEPRETERIFRDLVKPHLAENGGPLRIVENYEPAAVEKDRNAVVSVRFNRTRAR